LRRGAKKGESAVSTNAETAAKKAKKFRRIHGLLTGESRRERRAKKVSLACRCNRCRGNTSRDAKRC
jgi:hypothetical protein